MYFDVYNIYTEIIGSKNSIKFELSKWDSTQSDGIQMLQKFH